MTTPTPPSEFAYVTSADSQGQPVPGVVYQFAIGADGALTLFATLPTGVTPKAVITDQTSHYVYVANLGDATVSQYFVGSDGALTAMYAGPAAVPAPFTDADGYWLSQDASTRSLYVVANSAGAAESSVAEFSIGADGRLTPLTPAYIEVPAAASGPLRFDGSGRYAYLAGAVGTQSGQVTQFSVGTDGALSELTPASVAVAATPTSVAITPVISSSGEGTLYVLSRCVNTVCDGEIAQFSIGTDGTLAATGAFILTGDHVIPLELVTTLFSKGPSAYLLANLMGVDTYGASIYQYAVDATGSLLPYAPASVAISTGGVAEGVFGPDMYALSTNQVGTPIASPGGHVDYYHIGSDGLLTAAGTALVPDGLPTALAVPAAFVAP